jgi:hypothetical protein
MSFRHTKSRHFYRLKKEKLLLFQDLQISLCLILHDIFLKSVELMHPAEELYLFRLLDFGQETVVLSGLNKQAGESLKHIKNLYDETKYLKSYLEQVSVYHIDYITQRKCTS